HFASNENFRVAFTGAHGAHEIEHGLAAHDALVLHRELERLRPLVEHELPSRVLDRRAGRGGFLEVLERLRDHACDRVVLSRAPERGLDKPAGLDTAEEIPSFVDCKELRNSAIRKVHLLRDLVDHELEHHRLEGWILLELFELDHDEWILELNRARPAEPLPVAADCEGLEL